MRISGVESIYKDLMRESSCDIPNDCSFVRTVLLEVHLVVHLSVVAEMRDMKKKKKKKKKKKMKMKMKKKKMKMKMKMKTKKKKE